jgi:hypothetical protein
VADSAPNLEFQKFVTARKAYRQAVENLTFTPYAETVVAALHAPKALEAAIKDTRAPGLLAVEQQALDCIAASKRAVELRNKSFLDYVQDARAARQQVDNYEDGRVKRHATGRV